jgi:dsRNA-gated channel SID-1-like protein
VISRSQTPLVLLAPAVAVATIALLLHPIPQPLSYHNFADQRGWLGIPNFGDVVSNVAFAIVGVWGLFLLLRRRAVKFMDSRERWFYLVMFAGLVLTAFGSGCYHLAPDNARLVWDRIPIMMVFMALLTAVIAERTSVSLGLALFPALELIGVGSVLVWSTGELHGHGDLRFYAAVQVYAVIILLLALLLPSRYTRSSDFAVVVGFYALAKILEESYRQVFALGHIVSGHTLKHLAAAAAGYWIARMLVMREPAPDPLRVSRG